MAGSKVFIRNKAYSTNNISSTFNIADTSTISLSFINEVLTANFISLKISQFINDSNYLSTVSVDGTNAIYIDTSQRVGIGTTTPLSNLSVISGGNGVTIGAGVGAAGFALNKEASTGAIINNTISAYQFTQQGNGFETQEYNNVGAFVSRTIFNNGNFGIVGTDSTTSTVNDFWVNGNAAIGNSYKAIAAPSNGLIVQGDTGIGTSAPTEKLHVVGSIRMVDGLQAAGYIMTSDINGVGSWQVAPASGVTNVTATSPLISSGGTTPDISTSMSTNKLIGRGTAGTGVMEEITLGTGLSLTGTTLNVGTVSGSILHTTASGTDTYTATVTGVTSYNDGDAYLVRFTNGNTSGCTLNINSLGAQTLYRNNDGALIGGDIWSGSEMLCIYNSTTGGFQCIGTSPNSLFSYVTNADSVTLTKGQVVYAFGGTGDRMTVKRALNTSDATSAQTVGLVLSTSIAANQKGIIIMQGLLDNLSILPTSTYANGDPIYLGSTAGSITNVKQYAPNHLVYLGVVTTASAGSAGRMYVRVQNGYELDELHNVQAQSPTLKDTLWYDNTVSPAQWKTASISTILGYTPVSPTRTINTSSPLSGGGDLSADRTLSIADAAADGTTKGAATFTANDFNSSAGLISIDYTNGQAASGSTKGFLTSGDWTTFNSKQNALTPAALTKTDDTNVTLTLGGTPATALLQASSITAGWTGQLAISRGGTAGSTALSARTNLGVNTRTDTYALLGSVVQGQTFGMSIVNINGSITWSDARATYVLLDPMPAGLTITGVKFWQVTQGNFTADNNNKVGIYSYSGGTLTLVASCADDANLWKGTSSSWVTKAFSATFVTVANTAYFVAALYNNSAVVQNPIIGASPTLAATVLALTSFDFTNSARAVGFVASQNDLPATQAMSGFTALGNLPYFAVY